MNLDGALEVFNTSLDQIIGSSEDPMLSIRWIFQDFPQFQEQMLQRVFERIIDPPYLEKIKTSQPILPLVQILGFVASDHPHLREIILINKIQELEQAIVRQRDMEADLVLRQLVDYAFQNQWITVQQFGMIRPAFDVTIQPAIEEVIVAPKETVEEVEEPVEQKPRAYRAWMLPASVWGRGNSEDLSNLEVDDRSKVESTKTQKYFKVTPEYENKRCSVCGGSFTKGMVMHDVVFTDAEYVKGSGLVHIKCKPRILDFLT
ncbi:hypothetical protein TVAG_101670 [Trichomonas vaginalis G3]|uniref:Uncharacterized protein n=1 Tax=Trichomonas vaginalis (strain ATCC PRA-98 / G3) TaxID=412133 RepID=A2DJP9_TRIV3|nr:hypothetical protein TVAGG3_1035180 [Trichomonas vaginalis G3]EAY19449.1 hypothetical protein TVAG_101670 [Trichomonas vaginalis G3]KAI5493144.1 hypothetical protein TVAGG3_1035180 [Trichomonas vaginalis G3]|eukprot:XP_001580435.1 hypothetical protein [Trichomonas vaginalis G3]